MDLISLNLILQRQIQAAKDLSKFLGVPVEQLYYKWCKGEIQQIGKVDEERSYFFHGVDCSIKNQKTGEKIEICFAANGRVDGFDEGTLVMNLGIVHAEQFQKKLEEVKLFVVEMLKQGKIKRSDPTLFSLSTMINELDKEEKASRLRQVSSENSMDMSIAHRYILSDIAKN